MEKRVRDERGHFLPASRSYEGLLEFKSIKNWDMMLRSDKTKDFYFYTMYHFLNFNETQSFGIRSPDDLLKINYVDAVNLIVKFSHDYSVQGKERMAQMVKLVLKSFFAANDQELRSARLKTHKVAKTRRTYSQIVPTKEQVYSMAGAATSLRDKAIVLTLFQSGLRNGTLRELTVGHINERLKNNEVPLKIDIDPTIDKKTLNEPYYTFIDIEAIDAIRLYLDSRGGFESLPDSAPLFASTLGKYKTMSDMAVLRAVKRAAKNAGLDPRKVSPHCLRKSFYNMLVGKVDDVEREFMFGHNMGIREHYFAPQWIEKLRKAYSKVDWHRFPVVALTKEDIRTEVIAALLGKIEDSELAPIAQKLGITPRQIRTLIRRVGGETERERRETEALLKQERKQRTATDGGFQNNHFESKIVTEDELCSYLDEGWDLIKELSNEKLVVRRRHEN